MSNFDAWKTDAPDPGSVGHPENPIARTRQLWFEAFRFAVRQGTARDWLDLQREWHGFAAFVAEVDEAYCDRCFNPLVKVYGHYAPCEECEGGESLDGDAPRGAEAHAVSVDQQMEWQRLK